MFVSDRVSEGKSREFVLQKTYLAMICSLIGIPGYLIAICFIEQIGPKKLQLFGFCAMAFLFFLTSLPHMRNLGHLSVILFGFTFFFSNFGPNTTTYVIPALCYPTMVRATFHGISAAAGKIGAVIGVVAFSPLLEVIGMSYVLVSFFYKSTLSLNQVLCGIVCLLGALVTQIFTIDTEKLQTS